MVRQHKTEWSIRRNVRSVNALLENVPYFANMVNVNFKFRKRKAAEQEQNKGIKTKKMMKKNARRNGGDFFATRTLLQSNR